MSSVRIEQLLARNAFAVLVMRIRIIQRQFSAPRIAFVFNPLTAKGKQLAFQLFLALLLSIELSPDHQIGATAAFHRPVCSRPMQTTAVQIELI